MEVKRKPRPKRNHARGPSGPASSNAAAPVNPAAKNKFTVEKRLDFGRRTNSNGRGNSQTIPRETNSFNALEKEHEESPPMNEHKIDRNDLPNPETTANYEETPSLVEPVVNETLMQIDEGSDNLQSTLEKGKGLLTNEPAHLPVSTAQIATNGPALIVESKHKKNHGRKSNQKRTKKKDGKKAGSGESPVSSSFLNLASNKRARHEESPPDAFNMNPSFTEDNIQHEFNEDTFKNVYSNPLGGKCWASENTQDLGLDDDNALDEETSLVKGDEPMAVGEAIHNHNSDV